MKNASRKIGLNKKFNWLILLFITGAAAFFQSCRKSESLKAEVIVAEPPIPLPANLTVYIPNELKGMNLNDTTSNWCYQRSKQSEHFIIFWDKGFGSVDPNSTAMPGTYRFDPVDVLTKSEQFYQTNIQTYKFAGNSLANSKLSKYKMMIFMNYRPEFYATGAGYDDTVGAIWLSPNAARPAGWAVAHEIGHAFQYMVFSDLGGLAGFRYGFGLNASGGNGYWEQCANWQSFQIYTNEIFGWSNFPVYLENYHRHIHHEDYRYASYFMNFYWADKHGVDIVAKVWRNAMKPEDPVQAYMRITGINTEQFNDEVYDAAAHFTTWDLNSIRTLGASSIGKHPFGLDKQADGSFIVKASRCPETTGYNVLPLKVPTAGTIITTAFTGLPNAPGFNPVDATKAGWRFGYVALLDNGTRVYGQMNRGTAGSISFTVPQSCKNLWLVITGAPTVYIPHAWDGNNTNDEQWPYQVKFNNTTLTNDYVIQPGAVPKDATFNYNVSIQNDTVNYAASNVSVNLDQISQALALTPNQIVDSIATGKIRFYGVESNGTLNPKLTANGYGHWFDQQGNVIAYGAQAKVFSEYNSGNFTFRVGLYPKHVAVNDQYQISQALVYTYAPNKTAQVTFKFNVKIQ